MFHEIFGYKRIYSKKKLIVVHMKFKFNWASYFLVSFYFAFAKSDSSISRQNT